jgi:phenylacetate-CoA ligase
VLRSVDGLGAEFQVVISRDRAMDELVVRVEYNHECARAAEGAPNVIDALRERVAARLRSVIGIRSIVRLEPPGTLPRTEFKARRVLDNRSLYEESVQDARL